MGSSGSARLRVQRSIAPARALGRSAVKAQWPRDFELTATACVPYIYASKIISETNARAEPAREDAMTKADIIESVYEKVGGFSKKEAAEIVETVFDTIKETLEQGEKIKVSGFGNFVVRDKNARVGRNPQTGEEITISARRVLTFKPSQVLKNALNS
jgi:integration host factor subunit alpha